MPFPSSDPPGAQSCVQALVDWRDATAAHDPARQLSDDDFERIAASGARSAREVARVPVGNKRLVRALAGDIAAVLAGGCGADDTPAAPTEEPPPVEESTSAPMPGPLDVGVGVDVDFAPTRSASVEERPARFAGWEPTPVGARVHWPSATDESVSIYRVVSAELDGASSRRMLPPLPDRAGALVHVTRGAEFVDPRPFTAAARYYWVWRNSGTDEASARAAQPQLWAHVLAVSPVTGAAVAERHGLVVGRWTVLPGASAVEVRRHRIGSPPATAVVLPYDSADSQGFEGFVDRGAAPGEAFTYSVYVDVRADGATHQSPPATFDVHLSATPEAVTDLQVRQRSDVARPSFDVDWKPPPVGKVSIYLTERKPDAGLSLAPLDRERLAGSVLQESAHLNFPPVHRGGRTFLEGVPWPNEWARAHFTPVTEVGGMVQVGETVTFVRTGSVKGAVLRERVDSQTVTFDWPDGAADVTAYITPPGQTLVLNQQLTPQGSIARSDYDERGGLILRLPGRPVDVHLVPRAFDRGMSTYGVHQTIAYPGLARVRYRVRQPSRQRGLWRKESVPDGPPLVEAMIESAVTEPVLLSLVRRADRLPLAPRDGTLETQVELSMTPGSWVLVAPLPSGWRGYIRLFGRSQSRTTPLAVLDPDVSTLFRR